MVQALINISDETNSILNIVKAKYGLRTKSEAIDKMADEYEDHLLEFRPEFLEKLKQIEKQKPVFIGTIDDFKRHFNVPDSDRPRDE